MLAIPALALVGSMIAFDERRGAASSAAAPVIEKRLTPKR
jgi:hypothetical protein